MKSLEPRYSPTLQARVAAHLHGPLGHLCFVVLKLLGVDIPRTVRLGRGLRLPHGAPGLVIHPSTVIGDDVNIFQGVTVGRSDQYLRNDQLAPGGGVIIGDRVVLGVGSVVLFRSGRQVHLGDDAVVGANSVVLTDIPRGEIWAGAPATRRRRNPNARQDCI